MKTRTEIFDLAIGGKPIKVKATLYHMHTKEIRYRVSVNEGPVHIFAFDDEQNRLVAIDKGGGTEKIPESIEAAIGRQLYSRMAA